VPNTISPNRTGYGLSPPLTRFLLAFFAIPFFFVPNARRRSCRHDRHPGVPFDVDQWEWTCDFYPGMESGRQLNGTAADFDHARAGFEEAFRRILPTLSEANFQEWRDAHDWTARKYAMWERGELLPSQKPNTMMGCPCGLFTAICQGCCDLAGSRLEA
jgi:hypothetical protein